MSNYLAAEDDVKSKYIKAGRRIQKALRFLSVTLVIIILIPIIACTGCSIYIYQGETLLYTYETLDNHEISLYQKGHYNFLIATHEFIVKYDGEPEFSFQLNENLNENGLFPPGNIQCLYDMNEGYRITVNYPETQINACEFNVSTDFKEIRYAKCWKLKILSKTIKLGEYDRKDLF